MERTDKVTKVAAVFIFLALTIYIGVYIVNALNDSVRTALVVSDTVYDTVSVSGVVVRDEKLITSSAKYVSLTVSDGEKVSAGEVIGSALNTEDALARSNRQRELELSIARAEAILSGIDSSNATTRDEAIRSSVLDLTGAIASHDLSELDGLSLSLSSLIFTNSQAVSQDDLESMKLELAGLRSNASAGSGQITAQSAGIFSSIVDGYESLSVDAVLSCTPDMLKQYIQNRQEDPGSAFGKLVCSQIWYYAVIMDEQQAMELSRGDRVTLDFGRYYSTPLSARVYGISGAVNGQQVVVFSCSDALTATLSIRQATAEIITAQYSGLRVPSEAIYTDDDGTKYVYTMTGLQAERKDVEIVYTGDAYCIVKAAGGASSLRDGNQVIITQDELYDGKVMD